MLSARMCSSSRCLRTTYQLFWMSWASWLVSMDPKPPRGVVMPWHDPEKSRKSSLASARIVSWPCGIEGISTFV